MGKTLAARILPSRHPQVIQHWLDEVSQMTRAISDMGLPPLGGITDITDALGRAQLGGGAGAEDFAAIATTLEGAANVRAYLHGLPEELDLLHALAEGVGDFSSEVQAIRSIVGPDGTVMDQASQRLAAIRNEIASTGQHVRDVIYGYLHQPEVAKLLQNVNVTLHGDRYVLPVKVENRGRLPGVVHRASQSGATVFVEPNASVELINRLADLYVDERNEVQRLLNQLAVRVQARAAEIAAALRALAQIDLISAKAQYAYQFNMTAPALTERGGLQFVQARHPLLIDHAWQEEQSGLSAAKRHSVVPIDVRLGSDFDLLVITGSNTGGKTVTLKTVALLAVMAQSGMHIPVGRGSTLPVFHDVFLDVGDEQSLQQSLSTFGAHMKRIRYILAKAKTNCLVLLDELGAGTDPDEGGAIGQAVLDDLRRLGCLGMVTTHLSVLKAYAFNHPRVDNASVEFDTVTLRPTYHLRIGTPGESHAITVAAHLGLSGRIIHEARRHLGEQGKQFRRAIRATGAARQVAEEARAQALREQAAAQQQQEVYESKLADLHRLKEQFEAWLARLPELKAGDEVFVPSLGKTGRLARLELHRQIALIDSGNVQVEIPLAELMPDLGQSGVREQLDALRQQILDQLHTSQTDRSQAEHLKQELHLSIQQQKERARQFDSWLAAIARLKVGDEAPIARKPGVGKVTKVDLPGLRATVETPQGAMELSLQELFPQTGPFAPRPPTGRRAAAARTGRPAGFDAERSRSDLAASQAPHKPAPQEDRPMRRRSPQSRDAQQSREKLLATPPGQKVFVVPFNKPATLIRINADKGQAVVQSGAFEMELPLADLEPLHKENS
ncbi:MAG: MutS2/Smr-associated SH3 domain-containing protein [Phycisphaerae bacterium]